jgi:aspartate aminotransferase
LRSDQGFQIELETFMPYISPDTRMIVLVNPSNPTGRVYRNDELEVVARVAVEHDLLVVTDEVYEQVVFPGHRHISLATLPGMAERTISLFAFTKAFAMDGWRLGYLHAPTHMISAMLKISMNDVTHVNTFIQYGGLAALTAAGHSVQDMVADDCLKRDMVVERLNAMSGVRCSVPEGTIYVFPNIERTGLSSTRIAELLLEKAAVVVEDGAFYGRAGRGHLRVCFGSQGLDKLQLAMDRMTDFFHRIGASDEAGY